MKELTSEEMIKVELVSELQKTRPDISNEDAKYVVEQMWTSQYPLIQRALIRLAQEKEALIAKLRGMPKYHPGCKCYDEETGGDYLKASDLEAILEGREG